MKWMTWMTAACVVMGGALVVGCKKKTSQANPTPRTSQNNNQTQPRTRERRPATRRPVTSLGALSKEEKALIKRAKGVAGKAFQTLAGQLRKALKKGGVRNAVKVCSQVAMPLTQKVGASFKVALARVSHKPRNPRNQASARELTILNNYKQRLAQGESLAPHVFQKQQASTVYLPIVLAMPLCLRCHGTVKKDIQEEDYKVIHSLYPQDKAVGFKLGQIRGLWKITFAKTTPPSREKPAAR